MVTDCFLSYLKECSIPGPVVRTTVRRNSVLLPDTVKHYRSATPSACKQELLVVRPQGREWALLRWRRRAQAKARAARHQVLCPEDLYIVNGMVSGSYILIGG